MGLTRLLSRPLMREQETEDQTPTRETGEPPREAEVIAFANQKGGVAKTTSCISFVLLHPHGQCAQPAQQKPRVEWMQYPAIQRE